MPVARHVREPSIVILGAGLTGLAAARELPRDRVRLLERDARPGGHALTIEEQGFRFDRTGHLLHVRDAGIREMVEQLLGPELLRIERRSRVWSHGVYTEYPFQANTWGLPREIVRECLVGLVDARLAHGGAPAPASFEEFILRHFGAGIARHFMVPYNTKIWGVHPREMSAAWCDRFVPIPTVEEVVDGALGPPRAALGYNARFLYPRLGMGRLPETLAEGLAVELGKEPVSIDPSARRLQLGDGESVPWTVLVSTIPLPRVVALCGASVPEAVRSAAARLRWNGLWYLDVALRRAPATDLHWAYVPAPELPFYRVGVYTNFSPELAPAGHGSLYVELSEREPPVMETLWPRVREGLRAMGLVGSDEDVLFVRPRHIPWAYVLYDHAWSEARSVVTGWLERQNILPAGRYGAWNYSSMEDALTMGRDAARRASGLADA